MRPRPTTVIGLLAWVGVMASAQTPVSTAFTYQGQLKDNGEPANGTFDLRFRLFDAGSGGSQVGSTLDRADVAAVDGLFTTQLDFGGTAWTGQARWLDIQVRPGSSTGAYTPLSPRQPLTAAPFALYALSGPGSGGFWSASGSDIYSTNTGNVGIGIAPLDKLHVPGNVRSDGSLRSMSPDQLSEVFLGWGVDANGDEMARIRIGGGGTGAINGLEIQKTGDRHLMRILHNGKVGIGTGAPTAKLDVVGGSGTEPGVQASGHWGVYGAATSAEGYGGVFASSDGVFGTGRALLVGGDAEIVDSLLVGNAVAQAAAKLQVVNGTDAEPGGGGFAVVGNVSGANLSIDNNEIMARSNGSTSTLYLNADGGAISMGPNGIHPPFAYGVINANGSILSRSPNVVAVEHFNATGIYYVTITGLAETDVMCVTSRLYAGVASARWVSPRMLVNIYDAYNVDTVEAQFSFVIYRP